MEKLSRVEFNEILPLWYKAWNTHDLDAVMDLMHEDIVFVHWNGARVIGKARLREKWTQWFKDGGFRFSEEETFIDEINQKVLFRWELDWPSPVEAHAGKREVRSGLDVLHFHERKIIKKLSYTRTDMKIDGKRFMLTV